MAYAILKFKKLKQHTKGVLFAHNHRTSEIHHRGINPKLNHLNRYRHSKIGPVEDINERIAALKKKPRKDAVVGIEMVLTASPDFFHQFGLNRVELSENPEFQKWAIEAQQWVKDEFGTESIIDTSLHLDERSPHLHIVIFPKVNPQTGRLSAKAMMSQEQLCGYQDSWAEAMKPWGLERGAKVRDTLEATGKKIWNIPISTYRSAPLIAESINEQYKELRRKTKSYLARKAQIAKDWLDEKPRKSTAFELSDHKAKPNAPQTALNANSSHFKDKNGQRLNQTEITPKNPL